MNVFLVGLGLALLCVVNVQSECTGGQKVVEGRWYGTAMATDCKHFLDHKDRIKILAFDWSITKDDKFILSERGDEKMQIISTDCTTHIIAFMQMSKKNRTSKFIAIHTKEPELSPDLKAKFLEHARNLGFTDDQMMFPREVACENEA